MTTLLEKVKAVPPITRKKDSITLEDLELVIAWLANEVTTRQIMTVKEFRRTSVANLYVAKVLRFAHASQWIDIKQLIN